MSLLSRVLKRMPPVRRLEAERDALRGERDSMQLKVRAISARMGILEEQGRVLAVERDRCAEQVKVQTAEQGRLSAQLRAALAACDAVAAERDTLKADRDALLAQQEDAGGERDQPTHDPDRLRQDAAAGPMPANSSLSPVKEEASRQDH